MQRTLLENVKRRLYHYLGPDTTVRTGMTIGEQQQTIAGGYIPTADQLDALAHLMKLEPAQYPDTAVDADAARKRAIRQGVA